MPHVGTITGSMYLDTNPYLTGLSQASTATQNFQSRIDGIQFAGFNRGIFATTSLLYGLNRIISSMSRGMEDYSNVLGRIGTVADLTAASVQALADSMKDVSTAYGVSRKDIMGGMYTAAQSRFTSPAEMRTMGSAGALLAHASGGEISVKKAVGLLSGTRQALGIGMDAVSSRRLTDMMLRGRDIGQWELGEMATALGKVTSVYGTQYGHKIDGEEILRQLVAMMATSTLTNLPLGMVSTGVRRMIEKTLTLAHSGVGNNLQRALSAKGFGGDNPILTALNQGGPLQFAETLMDITGGGRSEMLSFYGYKARELQGLTSFMRQGGVHLRRSYADVDYGTMAGTSDRYSEAMKGTYQYARDQLRSQWEITSQEFMKASIPLISEFTNMLSGLNRVAQSLPDGVKSFTMLVSALTSFRLALNFLGVRGPILRSLLMPGAGGVPGAGGGAAAATMALAGMGGMKAGVPKLPPKASVTMPAAQDVQAARLARRLAKAQSRSSTWGSSYGARSGAWVPNAGMPWGTDFKAFKPMSSSAVAGVMGNGLNLGRNMVTLGTEWSTHGSYIPLNMIQQLAMEGRQDALLSRMYAANDVHWNIFGRRIGGYMPRPDFVTLDRTRHLYNVGRLARQYGIKGTMGGPITGREIGAGRLSPYGPTVEAQIRYAAYKQGQRVDFNTGQYGPLTASQQAYFANRGTGPHSLSVREMNRIKSGRYGGQRTVIPIGGNSLADNHRKDLYYQKIAAKWGRDMRTPYGADFVGFGAPILGMVGGMALGDRMAGEDGGMLLPMLMGMGGMSVGTKLAGAYASGGMAGALGGLKAGAIGAGKMAPTVLTALVVYKLMKGLHKTASGYEPLSADEELAMLMKGKSKHMPLRFLGELGSSLEELPEMVRYLYHAGMGGKKWGTALEISRGMLQRFSARNRVLTGGEIFTDYSMKRLRPSMRMMLEEKGLNTPEALFKDQGFRQFFKEQTEQDFGLFLNRKQRITDPTAWGDQLSDQMKAYSTHLMEQEQREIREAALARVQDHTGHMKDAFAYLGGYNTMFSLESMQKKPFQEPHSDAWKSAYRAGGQKLIDKYMMGGEDKDYWEKMYGLDAELDIKGKTESPFAQVEGLHRKLGMMRFFAEHGADLSDKDKVSDEMIIKGLGVDMENMSPRIAERVLAQVRGLDPGQWAQLHTPPASPFSRAMYYGSQEAYNATLERKDDPFQIELITGKLDQLVTEFKATEKETEARTEDFQQHLIDVINGSATSITQAIGMLGGEGWHGTESK